MYLEFVLWISGTIAILSLLIWVAGYGTPNKKGALKDALKMCMPALCILIPLALILYLCGVPVFWCIATVQVLGVIYAVIASSLPKESRDGS